jgi:hypothetical protein
MVNTEGRGGGVSLKIRDLPYYRVAPAGIMQVEYNLEPVRRSIWYDLSRINCVPSDDVNDPMFCPLIAGGIELSILGQPPKANCPHAFCEAGGNCHNVYDQAGTWLGEPSFACDLDADVVIKTCTHSAGPTTYDWKAQPEDNTPMTNAPVAPEDIKPIVTSPDGTCGGSTGYKCEGSLFGHCCSQWGYCGDTDEYCNDLS